MICVTTRGRIVWPWAWRLARHRTRHAVDKRIKVKDMFLRHTMRSMREGKAYYPLEHGQFGCSSTLGLPSRVPGRHPAILSMLERLSPAAAAPPGVMQGTWDTVYHHRARHPYGSLPRRAQSHRSASAHRIVSRRTWRRRGVAAAWAWRRRPSARCAPAASSPWSPPGRRASSPT